MTADFDKILKLDPLAEAEKMTGKLYKDDEETLNSGMILQMRKSKMVAEELSIRNDIHFGTSWTDALAIYEDLGFQEIFSEEFVNPGHFVDEKPKTEVFKVFWRKGFLLTAESYNSQKIINSSNLYYNWVPNNRMKSSSYTSSGSYKKNAEGVLVWSGHHDGCEGLRNIINKLENNGRILEQWQFVPFLWMLNFMVTKAKNYDYKAENARVISHFPQSIQEKILFNTNN